VSDLLFIFDFVARAVWNVWPAFLISVLLGVLVRALKLDGVIRRAFSARIGLAILLATAVGAFSPFCSCTVVPVVSGLLLAGVPLAPVMAFWIASPTMDPEIFALSVATLGWPLALLRLGATLAISVGAGYITLALSRHGLFQHPLKPSQTRSPAPAPPILQPAFVPVTNLLVPTGGAVSLAYAAPVMAAPASACTATSCGVSAAPSPSKAPWWQGVADSVRSLDWQDVGHDVLKQSWSLGRWLLLAFVLEALILRYVPQAAIASVLGQNNPLAVPLAALIGIPLYLNNISALPIVAGLLVQGMQPGAAIAFLIAGPVTTIPAMTAVWGIAKREVFALYLTVALVGSILAGVVTNLVL
jgi:uncharacterized protein